MSLQQLPRTIRGNPWPYAIAAWLALFVSGLAAWAVVAFRQDMDLVRPDYYEAEIRHEGHLESVRRTAAIQNDLRLAHDAASHELALQIPAQHVTAPSGATTPALSGRIEFYRPSNARLDFQVPLAPDSTGAQKVDTARLAPGLWKIRVTWTAEGKDYYFEQSLVL